MSEAEENKNQMTEWEKAREVIKDYDGRLHDLRKYGFSFVTALLTVGSFVTQAISSTLSGSASVETTVSTSAPIAGIFNLGVFIVTLMLIVALHFLDRNYRVYQQAAYTRASVIERQLNLELSAAIGVRYRQGEIAKHVQYVYWIFIFGVAGLGIAILYPHWVLMGILLLLAIGVFVFINLQERGLKLRFKEEDLVEELQKLQFKFKEEDLGEELREKLQIKERLKGEGLVRELRKKLQKLQKLQHLDWAVSPLECTSKEEIKVMVNNFNPKLIEESRENKIVTFLKKLFKKAKEEDSGAIKFKKGEIIWRIIDQYENEVYTGQAEKKMTVYDNHVWIVSPGEFKTGKTKAGVYRLRPEYSSSPLPISIIVHDSPQPREKGK